MPLIATSRPPIPVTLGIGCWMAVRGGRGPEFIWVVATREALEQLDHLAVFKKHRAKIEGTASAKFDREGPHSEDGRYDGRPVLVVRSDDLTHTG